MSIIRGGAMASCLVIALCSSLSAAGDAVFEDAHLGSPDQSTVSGPIRSQRAFAFSLEVPWNGLVGIGPMVHFYPIPNLCLDGGAGLAGTGIKFGIRTRALFTRGTTVPFVGLGFMSGSGTGNQEVELTNNGNTIRFKLARTGFLQLTGGVDIVTQGGFFFLGGAGYAACMNRNNVTITQGVPTDIQNRAMDLAYRGGLVLSVNFGYAIKVR